MSDDVGPDLTVAQAAAFVGVSRKTISQWVRDGIVPSVRDGRRTLIPARHLAQRRRDRLTSATGRLPLRARPADEGA